MTPDQRWALLLAFAFVATVILIIIGLAAVAFAKELA